MQPLKHDPNTSEALELTPNQHAFINKLDEIKSYLLMLASGHQ
jgi:hypothetical protein